MDSVGLAWECWSFNFRLARSEVDMLCASSNGSIGHRASGPCQVGSLTPIDRTPECVASRWCHAEGGNVFLRYFRLEAEQREPPHLRAGCHQD